MLTSEAVPTAACLKSRFLDGLAPRDLNVVLAAATQRHFFANSVVVTKAIPLIICSY